METALRGIGVSPGIAIGPARPYQIKSIEVPHYPVDDVEAELERFDEALEQARDTLRELKKQTAEELGDQHAAIFGAHREILDDVALGPEIRRRIGDEKINAEYIVNDIIDGYKKLLEQTDDPLFRERSTDFMDVGRRLLSMLLDREMDSLEELEEPCIVVAHDLSPSETANLDMPHALGLAIDGGGPTSHMAILARAFEIPSVVGLRYISTRVKAGDTLIVDGTRGYVIIQPTDDTLERYRTEKERQERDRASLIAAGSEGPALTLDGRSIDTMANIELLIETGASKRARCQGIGLYRTEFLFMNRPKLPTEEEQYETYRRVVETMAPLPVTIRTLDLGGDKILPEINADEEVNPQLGWRSIRLCLDRPDIFKAQLRALYRASVHGEMRVMLPMITGVNQLREAMEVVRQVRDDLAARKVEFDPMVPIGAMIEVPAAVVVADKLAMECDFFSIGTNDLIQYTLAVDRTNERTAFLYEPTHPAVLRMLKQTMDSAREAGIPCSICGEMAGDPRLTELLLGMGFDMLSMSSVSLPLVRAEVANTRIPTAKRLVRKVLGMATAGEIRDLLYKRHENRGSSKLYRQGAADHDSKIAE